MPIEPDMDLPCLNNDIRMADPCGYEKCIMGTWQPHEIFDYCNNHDDDCDQFIDENPVRNATSSQCCDEQVCYSRAFCENAVCVSLPPGSCRLDGDCEPGQICVRTRCMPHLIRAPTMTQGCEQPIELEFGSELTVSGEMSGSSFSFEDSGCNQDSISSSTEGYEVVFSVNTTLPQWLEIEASAEINGIDIPVTVAVYSSCDDGEANACHTNWSTGEINDVRFNYLAGFTGTYIIVIDTIGDRLREVLASQRAQLSDLSFRIEVE